MAFLTFFLHSLLLLGFLFSFSAADYFSHHKKRDDKNEKAVPTSTFSTSKAKHTCEAKYLRTGRKLMYSYSYSYNDKPLKIDPPLLVKPALPYSYSYGVGPGNPLSINAPFVPIPVPPFQGIPDVPPFQGIPPMVPQFQGIPPESIPSLEIPSTILPSADLTPVFPSEGISEGIPGLMKEPLPMTPEIPPVVVITPVKTIQPIIINIPDLGPIKDLPKIQEPITITIPKISIG